MLYNALLTKREDVIWRLFETITAVTRLIIGHPPDAHPKRLASTFYRSTCSSTPSLTMPTKDEKGTYFSVSF